MNPVITTLPAIEVVVPNEIIKAEVEGIKGSIVKTMQIYLHNTAITLALRVDEQQTQQVILTRREQFEQMRQQNNSVENLRVTFDLELA